MTIEPVPNVIYHDNLFRSLDVGANIDGSRDLGSIVGELENRLETTTGRPSTTPSSSVSTRSGERPRTG